MDYIIYTFDGTFSGFLSVVFQCFKDKNFECGIQENKNIQESFYYEYRYIKTDDEKAKRVINGIKNKISIYSFKYVYMAFSGNSQNRFTDILKYLELGFKVGNKVNDYKTLDFVLNVQKGYKTVWYEAERLKGFVRFLETKEGVLYSDISPDNNVLEILAEHFFDRLKGEKWIINDVKRKKCAVSDGKNVIIMNGIESLNINSSDNELFWQQLWKCFFDTISVEGRKNEKLQNSKVPKKYRKYMIEFLNDVN